MLFFFLVDTLMLFLVVNFNIFKEVGMRILEKDLGAKETSKASSIKEAGEKDIHIIDIEL
jgi:hypothetical protein